MSALAAVQRGLLGEIACPKDGISRLLHKLKAIHPLSAKNITRIM